MQKRVKEYKAYKFGMYTLLGYYLLGEYCDIIVVWWY